MPVFINQHDRGDLVRCSAIFTNSGGTAVDPTTVTFKFRKPNRDETTYVYGTDVQLVKDSTGNYHVDINANLEGRWFYRFESTGTGQAAAEHEFDVLRSDFYSA